MVEKIKSADKERLVLEVPGEKSLRTAIRNEVESWVMARHIIPPVSYGIISEMAGACLEASGRSKDLTAFAMICCGNAIWHPAVEAVPFNRRMLLLPQCLRNSRLCRGQQDEMGLLCSECGNCIIHEIQREAENLGYVVLITEGTTVATRLVESGKVDAVIGVGCMEVLQKMFASVHKYALPGIGIPLLNCGCKDTTADVAWIKEELYRLNKQPGFRLLNLNYLRSRTASVFGEEQLKRIIPPSGNSLDSLVYESLLAGGKRLRPLMTLLTYEAFSRESDPDTLNRLALCVECFHKASLIHDDIEDDDGMRYGKQTLHARYGVPVAINIGDLLLGEGYRLLASTHLPEPALLACLRMVAQGHRKLSLGQGIELMAMKNRQILSVEETLEVFEYKTAAAFEVSLLLGAIAAGADHTTLSLLEQFSRVTGIAYQIKDDLSDFIAQDGSFEFRKPSILVSLLTGCLTPEETHLFQQASEQHDFDPVRELVDHYAILQKTEQLLRDYIRQSDNCLEQLQNIGLKIALHEILGHIFKDYR